VTVRWLATCVIASHLALCLLSLSLVSVTNLPLPIYSTEASVARQAQLAADTVPVEETEPSPFATYGVLPVSFFGLSALAANEMFILNEESLLIGTWSCFLLTTYLQMGDAFTKSIATTASNLKETHIQGVDAQLAAIDTLTATLNARVQSVEEAKKMQAAFTAMLARVKGMAVHKQKRMLHQLINERLREVVQIETEGSRRATEYVVKTVNEIVVALFATSSSLRKQVLTPSSTLVFVVAPPDIMHLFSILCAGVGRINHGPGCRLGCQAAEQPIARCLQSCIPVHAL
jgi:hypothetical protein